jgi:amino acid adenylation domain-containing protein/FkbH-like protein
MTEPAAHSRQIHIAATFTADLILDSLGFWLRSLEIPAQINIAPYAQVLRELLDANSALANNQNGFNILLLRPEDWIRDRGDFSTSDNVEHLRSVAAEISAAVSTLRSRSAAPVLVFMGPASSTLPEQYRQAITRVSTNLVSALESIDSVHCCTHDDVMRLYPVTGYEDASADRIGHIPYTNEYFAALATLFARRMTVLLRPAYKVIAIDCDNTLWRGVCGEDGALGVELTPEHISLQQMLVRQFEAGMLLCLCTKNNPDDVWEVFRRRPEMPLREEHIVSSRINWNPKSSNLQSLAQELALGLDSFIFIDDSALECAEVSEHCAAVLALQVPGEPAELAGFVEHVWLFDHLKVTEEARRRTTQYRENRQRQEALEQSTDLGQFLASLALEVDISPMRVEQLPRVAELLQRTNQFNLNGARYRRGDIEPGWKAGSLHIIVVKVRDRFGDYGLVGAMLFRRTTAAIDVDAYVLSCRALGRGVEHKMLNELGRLARESGLPAVHLNYRKTARNAPAREFLQASLAAIKSGGLDEEEYSLVIPAPLAEQVGTSAPTLAELTQNDDKPKGSPTNQRPSAVQAWQTAALRFSRVSDLLQEMRKAAPKASLGSSEYVAPRTPTEQVITGIWAEVLGLDVVGIRDNFFELGGNSLQAVQVISRIGAALGLELPLHEFFEGPTVEEITGNLTVAAPHGAPIPRTNRDGSLPLSGAQLRLWFIDQLEEAGSAYHVPLGLKLRGQLDQTALRAALDGLLQRHEALRTTFIKQQGAPVQRVASDSSFQLELVDLRAESPEQREREVRQHADAELVLPFDLTNGPVIRGRLLQLAHDEHVLLVTMHHIVSDGWSLGVLVREIGAMYAANPLPQLPIQYVDYARWQRDFLKSAQLDQQLQYWQQHLQGAPELLELPTDRRRPAVQSYRGSRIEQALGPTLVADLKAFARAHNVTIAMALYTAWVIVLSRFCGRDDIVVGMPVANRRRVELEGLIGFFVNTLAVRIEVSSDVSVAELLQSAKETLLQAYAHQDVPFDRVVEALQPARSLSYGPIVQVTFAMQNAPRHEISLPALAVTQLQLPQHSAQFDLSLALQESDDDILLTLDFATSLFDAATVTGWARCFVSAVGAMIRQPECAVGSVPLLSRSDREQVVESFNATETPYARDSVFHELFEQQVRRSPDAIAVVCGEQQLTYDGVNRKANQLARALRDSGVTTDERVVLLVERSVDVVVGILAVLKAGGGYVPLDPNYPAERLAHVLRDSRPVVVLTQSHLKDRLPQTDARVIELDVPSDDIEANATDDLAKESSTNAHNLAYVIYTSGSTGVPKGVAIEHRSLSNLATWHCAAFSVVEGSRCSSVAALGFDAAVWEILPPLSVGATVVLATADAVGDPERLAQWWGSEPIEVGFLPTPMAEFFFSRGVQNPRLRTLLVGGDRLRHRPAKSAFAVVNNYGPTEATVLATSGEIRETDEVLHIGRPVSNARVYVLDEMREPVPIGVVGEIYIGGAGVARGYLGQDQLTAERFVRDPFAHQAQGRMYKTGDLGRWRADGTIEYVGRNDHQVKLRGYRIELGDIEAQLVKHAGVRDAVVVVREETAGAKRLVAYIVAVDATDAPSAEELHRHLQALLPEYMVPSGFVSIDRIPLTVNGKLDRRALPEPDQSAYVSKEYEPPVGETERILATIWQQLLHVDRIGRRDNFFELGGHSLLIVQMLECLRQAGLTAEVRSVFERPVMADLASALKIDAARHEIPPSVIPRECTGITPAMLPLIELAQEHIDRVVDSVPGGARNVQDIYPLAPLQEGILFHHLMSDGGGDAYVVPVVFSVASRELLDRFIAALQSVVDRHDILRTAVIWDGLPQPVQVVYRKARIPVRETVLDPQRDVMEQVNEWLSPAAQRLNLQRAPLMSLQFAADPHGSCWYVLLQSHHIVDDATSLDLVMSEAIAHIRDEVSQIAESVPYRNHVAHTLAYANKYDAETFFRSKLADVSEPTLPFGLSDVHGDCSDIEEATLQLDDSLSKRLKLTARRMGVSSATVFHAAWGMVAARVCSRDDIVFGSVLLGRMQGTAGAERALGMFINTLPLRLQLRELTAKELVEHAHRELIELLDHEQASLAVAQRCSGIDTSAPLFNSLLNYRHAGRNGATTWESAGGIRVIAGRTGTNYPITMSVDELPESFRLTAQTDKRAAPQRLVRYLRTALQSIVDAIEQKSPQSVMRLPVLPDSERDQVVLRFNATQTEFGGERLIHELFETQAERSPNAIAVESGGQSLSYADLNRRANQLARYLIEIGVQADQPVGLCVERSLEMIVGMLGILKAGAAYLPLDPNYPAERLHYMLLDAAPAAVLTQDNLVHLMPTMSIEVVTLQTKLEQIANYAVENLGARGGTRGLVYVIYTSGSTGRPKGTAMPHAAAFNLIAWHRQDLRAVGRRVLQFAALSFDVAFQEVFSTLCDGGTLVLVDDWVRKDARELLRFLATERVDRWFVPPMMLQSLAESADVDELQSLHLQDVITAGEQLRISKEIRNLFRALPNCRLHNHYGPTETHVVTALTLDGAPDAWPALPSIGTPIANTQIRILDESHQPVPLEVPGELFIGGANLARGYLGRPELTTQRFIEDAFGAAPGARLYRTGDLAAWRADGTIEYLGRNDDQIKIRGFRIELGEIEARLSAHEQIREAAVVAREDAPGEKCLVAYVTWRDATKAPDTMELRAHLQALLPEYMVPRAFVSLDTLPLTPSGKLNRRALPVPEWSKLVVATGEPPRGEIEEALASIWQELLRVGSVARDDDFFRLGGHSLLATRVTSRIRALFKVELPVRAIFEAPTVRLLALRLPSATKQRQRLQEQIDDMDEDAILLRIAELEREVGYAERS